MTPLHQPVGIFDAGIGSYAIVERVRAHFPQQDILYLADRASFPYGAKTPAELLDAVGAATRYLLGQGCAAVILASNAPSIVVWEALRAEVDAPIIGVFPPVGDALAASSSKQVAVLGVKSMVTSQAMHDYVARERQDAGEVALINASPLVDLVENFAFLRDPDGTQQAVGRFMAELLQAEPHIDVMTLSSTHLPWLRPFFERAAPRVAFLDPADSVLDQLRPYNTSGAGITRCVATETAALTLTDFNAALAALGSPLRATLTTSP
ncbi:MAG: aspartate/glutamate racemase family protein [Paludibacterium sp.]|uniref:glutamate racemase n=1 Tax=Paludibacterium sp. TaxID=1917523 RepID=UPI0025EB0DD8|nr:aspartate/glutamate racemase family protein [Paludibacterium sp.]MBV8047190.1 aspartate/glutamate racemase family protein [Paludibacterium sp.]